MRGVGLAGLICYTALLYYGTLRPFNFSVDAREHAGTYQEPEWLPFTRVCPLHGYEIQPQDKAINVVMFIPFGIMLGLSLPAAMPVRRRLWWAAGASCALSLSIETAQYFLPSRLPSASDVLLNTVSGVIGIWLLCTWTEILIPFIPSPLKAEGQGEGAKDAP
jgi:glycopeptide antibiotics resistance protein